VAATLAWSTERTLDMEKPGVRAPPQNCRIDDCKMPVRAVCMCVLRVVIGWWWLEYYV
jgi:hypothetical protein